MAVCLVSAIAVLGERTRAIGIENKLVWQGLLPDLQRFRALTMSHVVIMGRKTLESLPNPQSPLPGRRCVVITSQPQELFPNVVVMPSFEAALAYASWYSVGEIFIIGGAQIYALGLEYTKRLYLTLVPEELGENMGRNVVRFPSYRDFTKVIEREVVPYKGRDLKFLTLERP